MNVALLSAYRHHKATTLCVGCVCIISSTTTINKRASKTSDDDVYKVTPKAIETKRMCRHHDNISPIKFFLFFFLKKKGKAFVRWLIYLHHKIRTHEPFVLRHVSLLGNVTLLTALLEKLSRFQVKFLDLIVKNVIGHFHTPSHEPEIPHRRPPF